MERPSSYLVISRRYRPQTFEDLIGQEALGRTLKNAVLQNRAAHAYLFTGPRGVGKTSAARILAKALRCESADRANVPCNVCPSCIEITGGSSMNVVEIDAASNTGVDNIRDLRESVSYAATQGRFRIYIIDEVHMLSTAAFNALLKTLEEPPPHVVFIFATTEVHKVPATILSRCQRFDFKRITNDKILASLQAICNSEGVQAEPDALHLIAHEAEGSMRDAQSLLDQAIALAGKDLKRDDLENILGFIPRRGFFDLIRALVAHEHGAALELASQALAGGADPKVLLSRLVSVYRDLNFAKVSNLYSTSDTDYRNLLRQSSALLTTDDVLRGLDQCLSLQSNLNSSIDAQVAVEALVVKLALNRAPVAAVAPQPVVGLPPNQSMQVQPQVRTVQTLRSVPQPQAATPVAPPVVPAVIATGPQAAFQDFLRTNRPAWLPVLKSLKSIQVNGKRYEIVAENDFAGKRLASSDGQAVLKQCFGGENTYDVRLESSVGNVAKVAPHELAKQKLKEAKEDVAVQSALKAFKGKISETKILDEEN